MLKNQITVNLFILEDSSEAQSYYQTIMLKIAEEVGIDIKIDVALSLEEAYNFNGIYPPDILIVDLKLPDGDGFDVIKYFKEKYVEEEMYSIIITGDIKGLERELNKYNQYNIDRFFIKPIDNDILYKAFTTALKHMRDHKQSTKFYRMLRRSYHSMDSALTGILITDSKGDIEYANKSFQITSGYSERELIGNNPRILKSEYHPQEFYDNVWKRLVEGEVLRETFVNKKKDGTLYYQETTIVPYVGDDNKIHNYIAHTADVTEKRFRDMEYEAIVQSLPEIISIYDKDYVCLKVMPEKSFEVYSNFRALPGKRLDQIEYIVPEVWELTVKGFESVDNDPTKEYVFEYDTETVKGRRYFEVVFKRFNSDKYIVITRDITDTRMVVQYKKFNEQISSLSAKNKDLLNTYCRRGDGGNVNR